MAENIKISIDVDDGGSTKNRVKDANSLAKAYDNVTNSAKAVRAAMAPKTTAAVKGASTSPAENIEYGLSRAAGGTGAAGRDFAKQAQGLGGLVHVYATFAANLFAVGAAWRALSDAADTSNLVKGLDQIGAASGKNLGSVAKQMVSVSDGALSLRESLTSVALASSSGMSNANIIRMTEVAKKASIALGRDMPDSMDRLTKGIAKTQPELLDELGIMAKVIPSQEAYARTVGKTVSQLTDFEKKQAFANAVLEEGEKKFNAIDIAANPYSKLLASLKNIAQSSLEVVNGLLTPIISLLSQSPTALSAVIAGIGVMLLKQAIPALGRWREGLVNTAKEAGISAKQINDAFMEFKVGEHLGPGFELQKQAESYKMAAGSIIKSNGLFSKSSDIYKQAMSETGVLTEKHMSTIKRSLTSVNTEIAKYTELRKAATTEDDKTSANKQIVGLTTKKSALEELAKATTISLDKQKESNKAFDEGEALSSKHASYLSEEASKMRIAKQAMQEYSSAAVLSNVGRNTQVMGMTSAFKALMKDVTTATATTFDETGKVIDLGREKLTGFTKYATIASGTVRILGNSFMTLISGLSSAFNIIGVLAAAFGILDSIFSKTSKEQENFGKSLSTLDDSVANVSRTLDALSKKDIIARATIDGIFALANAMNDLTDASSATILAQEKLKAALSESPWDNIKNSFLSMFGGDIDTKLAESLTKSLQSSLKIFKQAGSGDEAAKAFKDALHLESLDTQTLNKTFKGNTEAQHAFEEAQKKLNLQLNNSSTGLQSFKSATEASTKAYQEFIQSTAITSPLFKLGASLEDVGKTMTTVLKGGITDVNAAFEDLTKHPEKFAQFGKAFTEQFIQINAEFTKTFAAYEQYTKNVQALDEEIAVKKSRVEQLQAIPTRKGQRPTGYLNQAKEQLKELELNKANLIAPDMTVFAEARKLFNDGASEVFKEGSRLIAVSLGQAAEKAALTIAQAKLGSLSGESLALETGRLKQRELDLQLSAIRTNIDLIKSQEALKASIDSAAAITAAADTKGKTPDQIKALEAEKTASAKYKEILESKKIQFAPTGEGEIADNLLKMKLMGVQRPIAQQVAAATIVTGQKGAESITTARAVIEGQRKDTEKIVQLNSDINQQEVTRLNILTGISNATTKELLNSISSYENDILANKQADERKIIIDAIGNATREGNKVEATKQREILGLVQDRQEKEKDNKGITDRIKLNNLAASDEKRASDVLYANSDLKLKAKGEELSTAQELIGVQLTQSSITSGEAEKLRNQLIIRSTINDFAEKDLKLQKDKKDALDEIDLRIKNAKTTATAISIASIAGLQDEKKAAEDRWNAEIDLMDKTKTDKMAILTQTQSMSEDYLKMQDVVKGAFMGMGDALVEFTRTGKLNFKSLVDDMLASMLRLMLNKQMEQLFSVASGTGGFNSLISLLTGTPSNAAVAAGGQIGTNNSMTAASDYATVWPSAKGNVFGVEKFAQGGAFTNSIVNSPTMFKFAKGTGMMGEAGPEAIMPLKRDANGNLGVRTGGQGQTSVVVNNYSTAQATTKETVDSRGNRKIDIVIGEIVAGEIGRPGSAVQQSFTNNFGTKPAMARR